MGAAEHEQPAQTLLAVREIVRDLFEPSAATYWADFLLSATLGWASFWSATRSVAGSLAWIAATVVGSLALYRAVLFIHELTHLRKGALPGFHYAWDLLIGIPMQVPSFLYLSVHLDHHRRTVYGTAGDPEYLPLASGPRSRIVRFLVEPFFFPIALVVRFAVLGPLSLVLGRKFREMVVEKYSALAINTGYRREAPPPTLRRRWLACETLAGALAITIILLCLAGRIPWAILGQWYVMSALVGFVNQVRTLGAHRYRNASGEMTVIDQLVDSVNTPGTPFTELWAPVGLRWHGLHHFLPDLPYHALGKAHRRLMSRLPEDAPYRRTVSNGLGETLTVLWRDAGRVTLQSTDVRRA